MHQARCTSTLIALLYAGLFMAQTVVTREDGRIWRISTLSEQGDSLSTDSGRIAKRDVLFVTMDKKDYVYNAVTGEQTRVKLKESCRACRSGRAHAAKYAGSGLDPEQFVPPLTPKMLADTLFIRFYRDELDDRGFRTDKQGHLEREVITPSIAEPEPNQSKAARLPKASPELNTVYLRNGDSLSVNTQFYVKGDTLCWFGGGRFPKDQVMFVRANGHRMFIPDRGGGMVRMKPEDPYVTACDKGALLGRIYEGSRKPAAQVRATNSSLLADPAVNACFNYMEARAEEESRTYVQVGIGAGPDHGLIGLKTVFGPNGSGLLVGLGTADGNFCYTAGAQVAVGAWFLNVAYGTYAVGAISSGFGNERRYTVEGFNAFSGGMIPLEKKKRVLLELAIGYSGGGSQPSRFGGTEQVGGVGFDAGLAFRIGGH